MDPVSMLLGGAMVAAGWVMGRVGGVRRSRAQASTSIPLCACEHVLSTHPEGGPCVAQVKREHYDSLGSRNGFEWVACPCQKYFGPEPITSVWAPPVFVEPPPVERQ